MPGLLCVNFFYYGIETILRGTWFISEFIEYHIRLFSTGDSGHGRPVYFHPLVLFFGCFPASIAAFRYLFMRHGRDTSPQEECALWMSILFWVVLVLFSIVKTKTVLYSSLAYYPITFFAARYGVDVLNRRHTPGSLAAWVFAGVGTVLGGVMIALPQIMLRKEQWLHRITDPFTAGNLSREVTWTGYESLVGVLCVGVCFLALYLFRRSPRAGIVTICAGSALYIQLFLIVFGGRIESHSQGGMITLLKKFSGRNDIYVRTLFKSYAQYFYTRKPAEMDPRSHDKHWLLGGDIDKPAYFIERAHKARAAAQAYGLEWVTENGGYVLLHRPVPAPESGADTQSGSR